MMSLPHPAPVRTRHGQAIHHPHLLVALDPARVLVIGQLAALAQVGDGPLDGLLRRLDAHVVVQLDDTGLRFGDEILVGLYQQGVAEGGLPLGEGVVEGVLPHRQEHDPVGAALEVVPTLGLHDLLEEPAGIPRVDGRRSCRRTHRQLGILSETFLTLAVHVGGDDLLGMPQQEGHPGVGGDLLEGVHLAVHPGELDRRRARCGRQEIGHVLRWPREPSPCPVRGLHRGGRRS